MNPNKVVLISDQRAKELEKQLRESGWHTFVLDGPESRDSFFERARDLPSDPPMGRSPNWDGFADSLSGGLIEFREPLIAIVWRDAHSLQKSDPASFTVALNVLNHVAADQWIEQKRGHTRNRVLFFILGSGPLFESETFLEDVLKG